MEKQIWDFLKAEGFNDFGAAGLMGNLLAESGLRPNNMEDQYQSKLGYNDESYTRAVDNGTYTNFVKDAVGYGLAQWTYWTRKQNLLNFARQNNKSIGDLDMQLHFLVKELKESFTNSVYNVLKKATSVLEASTVKYIVPLQPGPILFSLTPPAVHVHIKLEEFNSRTSLLDAKSTLLTNIFQSAICGLIFPVTFVSYEA